VHTTCTQSGRDRTRAGFFVALVIFLFVGLDAAWTYLVGAGVLLGIGAAVDRFVNRADPVPEAEAEAVPAALEPGQ
jgi:hypothetical protein